MKRILLKLSGEALAGAEKKGFDEATVIAVAKQIRAVAAELGIDPDDYMEARLGEYQAMFERDNLTDTQTMDDYLKKNNTTLDDLKNTWQQIEEGIRQL